MCIDATGSMGHLIEEVKSAALTFHDKLQTKCSAKQKKIGQLRVKVIIFRDYWADPQEMAMIESEFFDLETQGSDFENFVRKIKESGGGDEPENGLEALALALQSLCILSMNIAFILTELCLLKALYNKALRATCRPRNT